jgi:chromosome partitioning protein
MQIISFAHQKGGVGKSTLCFNAAAYLQKKGKTRIADLDVQETATNLNLLRELNRLKPFDVETATNNNELVALFEKAEKDNIDFLLVDCGGFDADINRVAISVSDTIITPVSTRPIEIFGLGKFIKILDEIEEDSKKTITATVVINNIHPKLKDIQIIEDLCAEQPNKIILAKSMVRARAAFVASTAIGGSVFDRDFDAKLAQKEIKQVCDEVILSNYK